MDGVSLNTNVTVNRTGLYPTPAQNNAPLANENFQPEENLRHGVPENVSKLYAAQESGYIPPGGNIFANDDTDAQGNTDGVILNPGESQHKAVGRKSSPAECQTCANRKYQDESDENDVSFQTPTHISPRNAPAAVLGHEREHVANAYEKERKGEAEVKSVSVTLHNDICPECGKVYVSSGVTHTEMKYNNDDNPYEQDSKSGVENLLRGSIVDVDF